MCDARSRPCLREASLDSDETRVVHYDGFARVLPVDGGLSGPSFQLLVVFHENHQEQYETKCHVRVISISSENFNYANIDMPEILRHIIVSTLKRLRGNIRPCHGNQRVYYESIKRKLKTNYMGVSVL